MFRSDLGRIRRLENAGPFQNSAVLFMTVKMWKPGVLAKSQTPVWALSAGMNLVWDAIPMIMRYISALNCIPLVFLIFILRPSTLTKKVMFGWLPSMVKSKSVITGSWAQYGAFEIFKSMKPDYSFRFSSAAYY